MPLGLVIRGILVEMGGYSFTNNRSYRVVGALSSSHFGGLTFKPMCNHRLKAMLLTSKTKKNPKKKFMRYSK